MVIGCWKKIILNSLKLFIANWIQAYVERKLENNWFYLTDNFHHNTKWPPQALNFYLKEEIASISNLILYFFFCHETIRYLFIYIDFWRPLSMDHSEFKASKFVYNGQGRIFKFTQFWNRLTTVPNRLILVNGIDSNKICSRC